MKIKIPLFFSVVIFLIFLAVPQAVQQAAGEGVAFCAQIVIPSLFPGFVLAEVILSLSDGMFERGRLFSFLFRLPSSTVRCWLIGLFAGFPAAADCASRMVKQGRITAEQGERCIAFTNNPGIVFVIGTVGVGLFHSVSVGIYLWVIQTVSAILVGICFAKPGNEIAPTSLSVPGPRPTFLHVFPKAVTSSVSSVFNVCGFILFFRVLISVVGKQLPFDFLKILFAGVLELTSGISRMQEFSFSMAVVASFLLGWSGFSVHFQILNTISGADLSSRYYFPGKGLQAVLSASITSVTYPIFFLQTQSVSAGSLVFLICLFLIITFVRFRREYFHGTRNFSTGKKSSKVYYGLH